MSALKIDLCLGLGALCLVSACGGEGGDDSGASTVPIASTVLAGVVGGEPWALDHAETSVFLSEGETTFFVTAYAEPGTPCELRPAPTRNELILLVPKAPGEYQLGSAINVTFVVDPGGVNTNLIGARGRLVVDQVTATSVRGGAAIEYNAQNQVNGQFEITVCPPR